MKDESQFLSEWGGNHKLVDDSSLYCSDLPRAYSSVPLYLGFSFDFVYLYIFNYSRPQIAQILLCSSTKVVCLQPSSKSS